MKRILEVKNRRQWRAWLAKHHRKEKEIWLIYHRKHTHKSTIAYEETVEEALCFGWIDSIIKNIDEERYVRKFTPRRVKSLWSRSNIRRAQKMIQQNKMTRAGLNLYDAMKKRSQRAHRPCQAKKKQVMPRDLKEALMAKGKAYTNFKNFAPGYQQMYLSYIQDAQKAATRNRRIKKVVEFARQKKKSVMI